MSSSIKYKFWIATKKNLNDVVNLHNKLKGFLPLSDPAVTFRILSELYVLHVELVKNLAQCYDFTLQLQRREIVKSLLESASKRMTELKQELQNIEFSEFTYLDNTLIAKKWTPFDLMIWRPPLFLFHRHPDQQDLINALDVTNEFTKSDPKLLIKKHERGRQGRVYWQDFKDKKQIMNVPTNNYTFEFDESQKSQTVKRTVFKGQYIRDLPECLESSSSIRLSSAQDDSVIKAAVIIQRAYRRYLQQQQSKHQKHIVEKIFNMSYESKKCYNLGNLETKPLIYEQEKKLQQLMKDLKELTEREGVRLLQQRKDWIMEDISDHIREWFRVFYDKLGYFHPFPEEVEKGTVLVLIDETKTVDELKEESDNKKLSKEEKKKLAEKKKMQQEKEKAKIRKMKAQQLKMMKKMKASGLYDIAHYTKSNTNVENMEKVFQNYLIDWKFVDEYLIKNHEPIKDWITASELAKIHIELRKIVDQFMRIEYELLQEALAKDNQTQYKPPKVKKPKNTNKKKGKGKGKKKKKDSKMTQEQLNFLYETLKVLGIITTRENSTMEDYVGEFNWTANETRDELNFTTSLHKPGDIKHSLQDLMFGMAEISTSNTKSVCLVGPPKMGKSLLWHIFASEIDAVFMNISPEQIFGTFENMKQFSTVLKNIASCFQPSMLFCKEVDRVFAKKTPADSIFLRAEQLQTIYSKKFEKTIGKNDRIMLVGTSSQPWAAQGKFKKAFQKFLYLPACDYGALTLMSLGSRVTPNFVNALEDYATTALAKVVSNYTTGEIVENIKETLNVERSMKIKNNKLQAEEILATFLKQKEPKFPLDEKTRQKFTNWAASVDKRQKDRKKKMQELLKKTKK